MELLLESGRLFVNYIENLQIVVYKIRFNALGMNAELYIYSVQYIGMYVIHIFTRN